TNTLTGSPARAVTLSRLATNARSTLERMMLVSLRPNEKELSPPSTLRIGVRINPKLTTKCWVGLIGWLGLFGWFKLQWFGANPCDDLLVCDLGGEFILHLLI